MSQRQDEMFDFVHKRIDHMRRAIIGLCIIVLVLAIYLMGRT